MKVEFFNKPEEQFKFSCFALASIKQKHASHDSFISHCSYREHKHDELLVYLNDCIQNNVVLLLRKRLLNLILPSNDYLKEYIFS